MIVKQKNSLFKSFRDSDTAECFFALCTDGEGGIEKCNEHGIYLRKLKIKFIFQR